MSASVYTQLLDTCRQRGGCFVLLIDPDRVNQSEYLALAEAAGECGVDVILVGSSFMLTDNFSKAVKQIHDRTHLPVVLFPGSYAQINEHADAILFTSLISGRNPQYLIDEQVRGAPLVKRCGLEPIPTGYMLVESGPLTSVQFISGTLPIPRNKYDIATAHAMAAECLGMKAVYLEAGSGASQSVPIDMVKTVAEYVSIPIMVGGGLHTPEDCAALIEAGASLVVVGNRFEKDHSYRELKEMAAASHPKEAIAV